MYAAVRLFGQVAWRSNARVRLARIKATRATGQTGNR
jgi:hypothetical protein